MEKALFIALIGQDLVIDYPFGRELQQWDMRNFYVDDQGNVRHKRLDMLVDNFIARARNPPQGKSDPRITKIQIKHEIGHAAGIAQSRLPCCYSGPCARKENTL